MRSKEKHKIHLVSLGCPKNTVDSERMLGLLGGNDYALTTDPLEADVVIVNTCGFIGPAKEESVDAILAAHRLRREGRCRGVVVTGCLSQRYETDLRQELAEIRYLDPAFCVLSGDLLTGMSYPVEYEQAYRIWEESGEYR